MKVCEDLLSRVKLAACEEAMTWLKGPGHQVPDAVVQTLGGLVALRGRLGELENARHRAVRQLRRFLRMEPISEKTKRGRKTKTREERIAHLTERVAKSKTLADWHRAHARRHTRRAKEAASQLMELEDIELTPQDDAELAQEQEAFEARCALSDGEQDPSLASQGETLVAGMAATVRLSEVTCPVDRDSLPRHAKITQLADKPAQRIDANFTVRVLQIQRETLAVQTRSERRIVRGDLDAFGPAKMQVTWAFLANLAILASQYAMPFHRFARLVSSPVKRFRTAEIARYYQYMARHLAPVYIHLGRSLANAPVLSGDDTPSLVLEVNAAQESLDLDSTFVPPWSDYATAATAAQRREIGQPMDLSHKLAEAFGFASSRKNGQGTERSFNTTVLSGRLDAQDPASTVIFYRSHLGSFGNLLDAILPLRKLHLRDLVIQSDLSTTNLVSDPKLLQRLDIKLAGCTAHARRPFALYADQDPHDCAEILHAFRGIPIQEQVIDAMGRNVHNTRAVRDVDERALWATITTVSKRLINKWSRTTPLGEGARYILRHIDRLTYYLDDVRVHPTNNFCERMLRQEKLIANNAMFRKSLSGQFALDIMRTLLQTAVAAEVDLAA